MRTVSLRQIDMAHATIPIGYEGENEFTQVRIDCKKTFQQYPDAVASLAVTDPSGRQYSVAVVKDGTVVVWNVIATDVASRGTGEIQINFLIDGTIVAKSAIAKTMIKRSIDPSGGGGGGTSNYNDLSNKPKINGYTLSGNVTLQNIGALSADALAEAIATALAQAKASGEFDGADGQDGADGVGIASIAKTGTSGLVDTYTITLTSGSTYTFTVTNGQDGAPGDDGQDGQDGFSPTVTVTTITGGHRVTITDAQGAHTFDVMDGQGGGGTVTVDDELSDTSTNPVQNKVITEEVTSLKEAIEKLESKDFDIDFDPGDLVNGVYAKSTGYKQTDDNYKYGLSNNVSIKNMDRFESVTVVCPGAYVNVFRRNKAGVAVGFDCTDYQQNGATVNPTSELSYINFTVRLNPNDSTALTEEQIETLTARIKVTAKKAVAVDNSTMEMCGGDVELVNGIYSSTSGQLITNHLYGDSLATPIEIGESGRAEIICPKYNIRTFMFPPDTRTGFEAAEEYQQGYAKVEGTQRLTRFAFIICKENSDSHPLSETERVEIKENLSIVYTPVKCGRNAVTENLISKAAYSSSVIGSPRLYLAEVPQESGILNSTASDVYTRYDAMCVAFPKWIKRMDDIGEDAEGNKIRHYMVRMFDPIVGYQGAYTNETETKVNYWSSKFSYRRALINAGVHGDEKASVWALVYWLEELLDSSEEWARFIKANYVLDIIPILNPWGFDNNSRNNKNDVNVNRDYLQPDNTKQPETLAITQYISSIKDDVFCALDLHTTTGLMGYFCTHESNPQLGTVMRLVNQVIAACVDDWGTIANALGSDSTHYPYSYGCLGKNDGTMHHYLISEGITNLACTVEVFKVNSDADLVKSTKIIMDEFANLLSGFLAINEAPKEKQTTTEEERDEFVPSWDWVVANYNTERGIATYNNSDSYKYITAFGTGNFKTNTEIPSNSVYVTGSPYCIKLPQGTASIRISSTAQSSKFYNGTGSRVIWTEDVSAQGETNMIKGLQRDDFNSSQMPVTLNVPTGADSCAITVRYNDAQSAESANALAEADGLKIEFLTTTVGT